MRHRHSKAEQWCIGDCSSCQTECEYSGCVEHKSLAEGIRDIIFGDTQIEFGLGGEIGLT